MFNPLSSVVRLFGGLFRRPPFEALRAEQSDALATLLWASVHADGEPTSAEAEALDGLMAELPTYWQDNGEERLMALRDALFAADAAGKMTEHLQAQATTLADFADKELIVATLIAASKEHWREGANTLTAAEREFLRPIAGWLGVDSARFDALADDPGKVLDAQKRI
jgi:hypothetical protein